MNYHQLGYKSYQEFLQSNYWKRKKAQVYATRSIKCCWICKTTANLNVHHQTYFRLGDEKLSDLMILCQNCHKAVHDFKKENPKLSLFKATQLYAMSIKNPGQYEIAMGVRKPKRKPKKNKNKYTSYISKQMIQLQENEFNRKKLNRLGI